MILRKQQKKFKLRFRAFKRKPFLFLRHFLLIIIFRFFGVIICLFFTVLPLPLSNFIQHLMNLNLSLNSLKDILSSVKQLATNFYTIIPSTNDIMRFIKSFLLNFSPSNFYNILRSLPHDLRQLFLQIFDYLRQRLKDIRLFIRSLFPLRQAFSRFHKFIITFIGVDITLIIIATLSLLTSQLGTLIGKLITNTLIHLYDLIQRRTSKMNIFLFLMALIYHKISLLIKKIRLRLIYLCSYFLRKICSYLIVFYLYYKIQRQKF